MTEVPLREYFEAKLKAMEERFKTLREADQAALKLQANEYERRLDLLNNEHARMDNIVEKIGMSKVDRTEWNDYHRRQMAADFIGRTEFSAYKETQAFERATALGIVQGKAQITALVYAVVAVAISAAAAFVSFLFHR